MTTAPDTASPLTWTDPKLVEAFYRHQFAAIDAGNAAQARIRARVQGIILLIRAFNRTHQARIDTITDGINHRHRLSNTLFDVPNRASLHEVDLNGGTQTVNVTLESTFRNESDYHRIAFPYAWLWMADADIEKALEDLLVGQEASESARREQAQKEEERREREQYERLRDRFGGPQNEETIR